ncbi:MAG TPA: hypothetical protein P5084_00590 [Paludibacter sp.]|nr:hypothetical protein [Paludibacter sp.]
MNATQQKFKPILFSNEMVQAILAGRKTQTRRILKVKGCREFVPDPTWSLEDCEKWGAKPKYEPGDILWVRETCGTTAIGNMYKASVCSPDVNKPLSGWKPSIHMPKEAARIFLKVTNVRVERLQDVSEDDAVAEGIDRFENTLFNEMRYKDYTDGKRRDKDFNRYPEMAKEIGYSHFGGNPWPDWRDPISSFQTLWQSINAKKHPWESNPWVWVYTFKRIEKPENF